MHIAHNSSAYLQKGFGRPDPHKSEENSHKTNLSAEISKAQNGEKSHVATPNAPAEKNSAPAKNSASLPAQYSNLYSNLTHKTQSALLTAQEQSQAQSSQQSSAASYQLDTSKGQQTVNLDAYYSNEPQSNAKVSLSDIPLMLPTAANISALAEHASARFSEMLEAYNIPSAPEKITYNREGRMILPDDYPHKQELMQALEENPGLARELRDISALSSHYAELQKRLPMMKEMQNASSQADVERIVEKYRHLFTDNGSYSDIALTFSKDGTFGINADGVSLLKA